MLVETYDEHALGKSQCFEWFKKFRSGNFDVRNEERGSEGCDLLRAVKTWRNR